MRFFAILITLFFAVPALATDGDTYQLGTSSGVRHTGWFICDDHTTTDTCSPVDGAGAVRIFPPGERYLFTTDCNGGGGTFSVDVKQAHSATATKSTITTLTHSGDSAASILGPLAGILSATITVNTCASFHLIVEVY